MKKTTGNLFKRNGVFYLRWMVNGKRKAVSLKVTNLRDAEAERDKLLSPALSAKTAEEVIVHVANARKIAASVSSVKLFGSWSVYMASAMRPDSGDATLVTYERYWKEFVQWLEVNRPHAAYLSDLTSEMAISFFESLGKSVSTGRTFNAKLQGVRLVYKVLAQKEGLDKGLLDNIQRRKSSPVSRKELSQEQLMDLLSVFDAMDFHIMNKEEMRVLFHLGAYTGMRLADCATLRWENVDMLSGQIRGKTTQKTGAALVLPVHPLLAMRLRAAAGWRDDSGYVLPNVAERQEGNPTGIVKDCAKVFARIGLDSTAKSNQGRAKRASQYGFHSLRHTFVSICASLGAPMALVQNIVGHANPAMTRHYTHLGVESLRNVVDLLPSCSPTQSLALPDPPTLEARLATAAEMVASASDIPETFRAELLAILR